MECLIGIKGKDFVLMAADCTAGRSIISFKNDHDKMFKLTDSLLMSIAGDGGDPVQFAEYIAKNIQLYRMRNGYDLSTRAAATFTRRTLADFLRSASAYHVNLLIGGFDPENSASLYYMDWLASSVKVPFAVYGYGSHFVLSIFDRYYREGMEEAEAIELLQRCVDELGRRFIVSLPRFKVRIVNKDGIQDRDYVVPASVTQMGNAAAEQRMETS